YEQAQATIEQQQADALNVKKESLLVQAGYSDEQTAKLSKLVEGNTDEEISQSIEDLKATFPVKQKYVDPSVGNGKKETPEKVDGEDVGRNMFESLLKSGKIRGFKE